MGKGRSFYISMRRARSDIRTVGKSYLDGTPGEPVAVFNAMGLLEIAICMGATIQGTEGLRFAGTEVPRSGANRIPIHDALIVRVVRLTFSPATVDAFDALYASSRRAFRLGRGVGWCGP